MKYQQLGQTDITVSVMAMGCWTLAGDENWGRQDEDDSIATVHAALDNGINFFDTAEGYGDGYSELVLGKSLAGVRHEAVIATKMNASRRTPAEIQQACEDSLRRLRTDYIDLYQVHWRNPDLSLADMMESLHKLQAQGKVRSIGVCNFGGEDLLELLEVGRCETNQLPYSLLWRAIEFEIKPACQEHNLGILAYSVLLQGLLSGKFKTAAEVPAGRARTRHFSTERPQTRHNEPGCEAETFLAIDRIRRISQEAREPMARVAAAWVLHQPGISAVLVGARTPQQIAENVPAVDLELPGEVVEELTGVTEDLKKKLGSNPDLWQSKSRFR